MGKIDIVNVEVANMGKYSSCSVHFSKEFLTTSTLFFVHFCWLMESWFSQRKSQKPTCQHPTQKCKTSHRSVSFRIMLYGKFLILSIHIGYNMCVEDGTATRGRYMITKSNLIFTSLRLWSWNEQTCGVKWQWYIDWHQNAKYLKG